MKRTIVVGARSSPLSRAQVEEVQSLLQKFFSDVFFEVLWFETEGDLDQKTSLLHKEKTDFFTKEIDAAVLQGVCSVGIHSAKDLPDPLREGLEVIAYTEGVDSSDVLVFREGESLENLLLHAKVGTSSLRRERNIKGLRSDLVCVDIRGPIQKRLDLLDRGEVDALVMAKAALLRLKIERKALQHLPGEIAVLQGKLAIVARKEDVAMKQLFSCIHKDPFL